MDEVIDNIKFPQDSDGIQLTDDWALKGGEKHGFATNMGISLATVGFVIEIVKPDAMLWMAKKFLLTEIRMVFWVINSQVA